MMFWWQISNITLQESNYILALKGCIGEHYLDYNVGKHIEAYFYHIPSRLEVPVVGS